MPHLVRAVLDEFFVVTDEHDGAFEITQPFGETADTLWEYGVCVWGEYGVRGGWECVCVGGSGEGG